MYTSEQYKYKLKAQLTAPADTLSVVIDEVLVPIHC